ncbi:MAG: CheR family methyltransferase, partial [Acidimicrobiales bacterium]
QAPFEALRHHVLPERIAANRDRRQLALWSAACSTGQEPYSLAILLDDAFPELAGWQVDLVATDLSAGALERARAGRYSALEVNRGLPLRYLDAYFRAEPAGFRLVERVREKVRFSACNLVGPWPPLAPQDVILLRNVLIYFDPPSRRRVLAAAVARLRPGGYLVLGTAETTRAPASGLAAVTVGSATVYRREDPRGR